MTTLVVKIAAVMLLVLVALGGLYTGAIAGADPEGRGGPWIVGGIAIAVICVLTAIAVAVAL